MSWLVTNLRRFGWYCSAPRWRNFLARRSTISDHFILIRHRWSRRFGGDGTKGGEYRIHAEARERAGDRRLGRVFDGAYHCALGVVARREHGGVEAKGRGDEFVLGSARF